MIDLCQSNYAATFFSTVYVSSSPKDPKQTIALNHWSTKWIIPVLSIDPIDILDIFCSFYPRYRHFGSTFNSVIPLPYPSSVLNWRTSVKWHSFEYPIQSTTSFNMETSSVHSSLFNTRVWDSGRKDPNFINRSSCFWISSMGLSLAK